MRLRCGIAGGPRVASDGFGRILTISTLFFVRARRRRILTKVREKKSQTLRDIPEIFGAEQKIFETKEL